ncbi:MAG: GTPase HflX [Candidatus Binatia bacterium]|nr:GTPase HflX [Candidatus Binatia bacterium]MDG2010755.1 GTPase HflX [Candidatus Binatia bacterium]
MAKSRTSHSIVPKQETAYLVGFDNGRIDADNLPLHESLDELERLCESAGARVIGRNSQKRPQADIRTYVGAGKVQEIRDEVYEHCADLVVFDDPLTVAQLRNLERELGLGPGGEPCVRVIDRSQLILDIFAGRAQSLEGKLQVELAQLEYLVPRLTRHWTHLSRQRGGGVGTRGPGETQLEVDRRSVRDRMAMLRRRLKEVARTRDLHRRERAEVPFPTVALVGYTNAGKSTLMRALTGADVLIDDLLFATLDPTVRKLNLERSGRVLLSDTVGFVHKLPHELVEAFKSTLEEVRQADLLIHLIDSSSAAQEIHRSVVRQVLAEIDASDIPILEVWNKTDRVPQEAQMEIQAIARREGGVAISAAAEIGLEDLQRELDRRISRNLIREQFFIPIERGDLLARLHREGSVLKATSDDRGTQVEALVNEKLDGQIRRALQRPEPC